MFPGMGNLNMGNGNLADMQQQFQQQVSRHFRHHVKNEKRPRFLYQIMSNPAQLRQFMESPVVQSITNNPEVMRSLLMNNPQIRDMMEVGASTLGIERTISPFC